MSRLTAVALMLCLGAAGCGASSESGADAAPPPYGPPSDIDLTLFQLPTGAEQLEMAQLTPRTPATYIEFRKAPLFGDGFDVLDSAGSKCAEAADPAACSVEFDGLFAFRGFHYTDHPADKMKYLVVNRGNDNTLVNDDELVTGFLGTIDNRHEALLLLASHNYHWSPSNLEFGAIRDVPGGYEIIATKTLLCPLETTGYLLRVVEDAQVSVLQTWVIMPAGNQCS